MAASKLPSIWQLFKSAGQTFWRHPKLFWLVGVVLLPTSLITLGNDPNSSALASIAATFMNLALIWAILELGKDRKLSIKTAYFEGTANYVRYILTALVLALMMVPLLLAFYLVGIGILQPTAQAAERVLLGVLAIVLATPSVYWLNRYLLAMFAVVDGSAGPITAIRRAGALVKNRFWSVLVRLAAVVLMMVILGIVPLILELKGSLANPWVISLLQFVIALVALPLFNLYLFGLYNSLNG